VINDTLIGGSGEKISITEDDFSFLQRGGQHIIDMFLAISEKELQLLFWGDTVSIGVERSNLLAELPVGRFSGFNDGKAFLS
jgi:hypothetical protein